MPLPDKVSDAVRRLNPTLYPPAFVASNFGASVATAGTGTRLRQVRGPKLNKTETDLLEHLRREFPGAEVEPHAVNLTIANGCRYLPDFLVQFQDGRRPLLVEAKGAHAWDDAIVKIKVAAARHRWADFWLAYRDGRTGPWKLERVLP
jgi:hypothetical protein